MLHTPEIFNKGTSFVADFFGFIKKYGVIGLALGVVIGGAVKTLVDSFVKYVISPILGKILGQTDLSGWVLFGNIAVGSFLNEVINFLILMFIVYFTITVLMRRFLSEDEKTALKL